MGTQLLLLLSACIVNFGLTSVQAHNQMVDQPAVISKVNEESRGVRKNFQNLFSSIAKNDASKSETYHEILKEEVAKEQEVFGAMKQQLQIARNRNAYKKMNLYKNSDNRGSIIAAKRETNDNSSSDVHSNTLDAAETTNLFEAARNNDVIKVRSFVEERRVPISVTNDIRQTLAHVAALNGSVDVVKYVAEQLPSILTKTDKYDFTPLKLAVRAGAFDVVKYLVENHEADLTKKNDRDFRSTSMHTAIRYDRLEILKYLVDERNFNIDTLGEWIGQPPIFTAVKYHRGNIVKYLVDEKNVDLQQLDSRKENILFMCVRIDDFASMKYLLEEKILPFDINWKNMHGETLLYRAASLNRTDIIKYLVGERSADVNIACNDQMTPLHCAATLNNYEICKYLIEHEAKPDSKDRLGQIPADKATDLKLKNYLKSMSILKAKPSKPVPASSNIAGR